MRNLLMILAEVVLIIVIALFGGGSGTPAKTSVFAVRVIEIGAKGVLARPYVAGVLDLTPLNSKDPKVKTGDVLSCTEDVTRVQYREHDDRFVVLKCDEGREFILQGVALSN